MSHYDFSYSPDRTNSGSVKWFFMKKENPDLPEGIVPLSAAEMELPIAPEIREAMIRAAETETPGYTLPYEAFFQAIAHWMKTRHSWEIETDWICPINGVVPAADAMVDALGEEGCGVIIMTPVYYPFYDSSKRGGCHTVECPLIEKDGYYTIDFALLEKLASVKENRMLLLCSPHNPVGRVWTKEELHRIADICLKHDVFVISDEIHFDLIMPGYSHTVFAQAAPEMAEHCAVCAAPSKTFNIAGLETAYMIIPNKEIRDKVRAARRGSPSFFGYRACIGAYLHADKWLDECLALIARNARTVNEFIREKLPWVKVSPLEGTYLMWLDFRKAGLTKEELEERMKEHFLFFDEGYMFGEAGTGFERIAVAVPETVLQNALNRLYEALKDITV